MRFGIKTNPQSTTWPDLLAMWRRADELDIFESAWLNDHFYPLRGDLSGPSLEAWSLLAALAHATRRLRIGTMVNAMPYRHPAVTAKIAATVDIISGGRLELGLGAGWYLAEADAYGISLGETLRDRMDAFDEGVEAIVRLLTEPKVTLHGRHVRLTDAYCEPKGPQRPPPVVIGGGGERRTLRTVARWAHHWNSVAVDLDTWLHKREVLAAHCADAGRDPATITTSMLFRFDPDDAELPGRVTEFAQAGLDVALFVIPPPHHPDQVDAAAQLARDVLGF